MNEVDQIRVGAARVLITPPLGIYLIGYGDRVKGCQSVHDDLTATAIYLDDGTTQLAIIALDMLVLNEYIVERIRAGVATQFRLPAEQLMICCSHTHAGPIAYAGPKSQRKNRRFIDNLVGQLIALIGLAQSRLRPARLTYGQGEAHIAVNRRQVLPDGTVIIGVNADGPVDRSLDVLQLQLDGALPIESSAPWDLPGPDLLTLVNFACHPTLLGPDNYMVSAEWPGAMRRLVEQTTGGWCLFIQGAAGDLNPNHEWGNSDLSAVETFGRQVANAVIGTIHRNMRPLGAVPLAALVKRVSLSLAARLKSDGTPMSYQEALAKQMQLPRTMVDVLLNARYPWRNSLVKTGAGWSTLMEIQVFRVGECALVAQAAEVFNEIGTEIKRRSSAPLTWFAGCSNGCIGYLPTAAAHELGGYEVELAPYFYRLPGLLDPGCEALVVDHSLNLIDTLFTA